MGVLKAKVGGAWVPISQGWSPLAGGRVGHAYLAADQTIAGTSAVDLTGMSVTWTADPTRTYKTTVVATMSKTTAIGNVTLQIADAAGGNITTQVVQASSATDILAPVAMSVESGLSGTTTRKARASTNVAGLVVNGGSTYRTIILVEDITTVLPGPSQDMPWTNVTFQNGWANKGGSETPCQYRRIGDIVYLRGVMTKTGVAYGQAAFTLPAGFIPPYTLRPNPLAMNAAGTQSIARADVVITTGVYSPQAGPSPDVGWWAIDMAFSVTA